MSQTGYQFSSMSRELNLTQENSIFWWCRKNNLYGSPCFVSEVEKSKKNSNPCLKETTKVMGKSSALKLQSKKQSQQKQRPQSSIDKV